MKKMKLKIIVKMGRGDNYKNNYDVDYNDDECEDIGKVREMKIGQEDEENKDNEEDETEVTSEDGERR